MTIVACLDQLHTSFSMTQNNIHFSDKVFSISNMSDHFKVVISAIKSDPSSYSEVVLERNPEEYCGWIAQKNAWGGAIELAIFSEHFKSGLYTSSSTLG